MGEAEKVQPMMRIYMKDVIAAGHCPKGARRWFHDHRLDFNAFLKNGIDVETFLSTNDGHAQGVYEAKLKRQDDGQ
jgi:hypothetical protein